MRGWGVTTGEPVEINGVRLPVAVAVHRCANRDCDTALVVTTLLGSGYVPAVVEAQRLAESDALAYRAGRHDRAGVWLGVAGEPRTAPPQRDLFG